MKELRDIMADRILEHYPAADRKLALHMADHITPLVDPIAGKTSREDDVLLRPQKVREIKMVSEKRLQELIVEARKAGRADKQKVKEILKIIWRDASKWGVSFGDTPAVDEWLDKKVDEICQLLHDFNSNKSEGIE